MVSVPIERKAQVHRVYPALQSTAISIKMFAKVVICLVVCATLTSAAVLPLAAAPLAAAGIVAPYATSYNAHTVNHNIAAPYVAAAAPLATARYVAAPVAAPVARYVAAAPAPLAYAAASPYTYPYLF